MTKLTNLKEEFSHLSKAPIVEAALDIRIIPTVKWDENNVLKELRQRISDYPSIESLRQAKLKISKQKQTNPIFEDFCVGFKLRSVDKLNIAQFNKDSFVFSRLNPYEDWEHLSSEALRLWAIYYDFFKPEVVNRVGLRFINRLPIKQENINLADYYTNPPKSLEELKWPLIGYLHHDVMQVPGTPYRVNLINTIQRIGEETGLILDIDVFMQKELEYNESRLKECLEEMRWVKNKVFFSSLKDDIIEGLK